MATRSLRDAEGRALYWLGFLQGASPLSTLLVCLTVSALLSTGILFLQPSTDINLLFIPPETPLAESHEWVQEHFLRDVYEIKILLSGEDVLQPQVIRFLKRLDQELKNITLDGLIWEDICARPGSTLSSEYVDLGLNTFLMPPTPGMNSSMFGFLPDFSFLQQPRPENAVAWPPTSTESKDPSNLMPGLVLDDAEEDIATEKDPKIQDLSYLLGLDAERKKRRRKREGRRADELEGEDYWAYVAEYGFPDDNEAGDDDNDVLDVEAESKQLSTSTHVPESSSPTTRHLPTWARTRRTPSPFLPSTTPTVFTSTSTTERYPTYAPPDAHHLRNSGIRRGNIIYSRTTSPSTTRRTTVPPTKDVSWDLSSTTKPPTQEFVISDRRDDLSSDSAWWTEDDSEEPWQNQGSDGETSLETSNGSPSATELQRSDPKGRRDRLLLSLGPCMERSVLQWFYGRDLETISRRDILSTLEAVRSSNFPVGEILSNVPETNPKTGEISGAHALIAKYFVKDAAYRKDLELLYRSRVDALRLQAPLGLNVVVWSPESDTESLRSASLGGMVMFASIVLSTHLYMLLTIPLNSFLSKFLACAGSVSSMASTLLTCYGLSGYLELLLGPLHPLLPFLLVSFTIPVIYIISKVWHGTTFYARTISRGLQLRAAERCGLSLKVIGLSLQPVYFVHVIGFSLLALINIPTLNSLAVFGVVASVSSIPFACSVLISLFSLCCGLEEVRDRDAHFHEKKALADEEQGKKPQQKNSKEEFDDGLASCLQYLTSLIKKQINLEFIFGHILPPLIVQPITRIFVLVFSLGMMGMNLWSCVHLDASTNLAWVYPSFAESLAFQAAEQEYFQERNSASLYLGPLELQKDSPGLQRLSQRIKMEVVGLEMKSVVHWVDAFMTWLKLVKQQPEHRHLIKDPLRDFFRGPYGAPFKSDIRGRFEQEKNLTASRVHFAHSTTEQSLRKEESLKSTFELSKSLIREGIHAYPFSETYVTWAVEEELRRSWPRLLVATSVLTALGIAFVLGRPWGTLWTLMAVSCTMLDVLGTVAWMELPLGVISPIVWILSLTVALIPAAFVGNILSSNLDGRHDFRSFGVSLVYVGPVVIHSAVAVTIAGSVALVFDFSVSFNSVAKVLILSTWYAAFHSLVFLPSMALSLSFPYSSSTTSSYRHNRGPDESDNGTVRECYLPYTSTSSYSYMNAKDFPHFFSSIVPTGPDLQIRTPESWPEFTLLRRESVGGRLPIHPYSRMFRDSLNPTVRDPMRQLPESMPYQGEAPRPSGKFVRSQSYRDSLSMHPSPERSYASLLRRAHSERDISTLERQIQAMGNGGDMRVEVQPPKRISGQSMFLSRSQHRDEQISSDVRRHQGHGGTSFFPRRPRVGSCGPDVNNLNAEVKRRRSSAQRPSRPPPMPPKNDDEIQETTGQGTAEERPATPIRTNWIAMMDASQPQRIHGRFSNRSSAHPVPFHLQNPPIDSITATETSAASPAGDADPGDSGDENAVRLISFTERKYYEL